MRKKMNKGSPPTPRNHIALAMFKRQGGFGPHRKPEKTLRRAANMASIAYTSIKE